MAKSWMAKIGGERWSRANELFTHVREKFAGRASWTMGAATEGGRVRGISLGHAQLQRQLQGTRLRRKKRLGLSRMELVTPASNPSTFELKFVSTSQLVAGNATLYSTV